MKTASSCFMSWMKTEIDQVRSVCVCVYQGTVGVIGTEDTNRSTERIQAAARRQEQI